MKFWASWCSICLSTLKHTDELAKENGKDYVILSVVSPGHKGEKSEADFKKWYSKLDYKNLPVLIDSSGKLLEQYGVRSYPTAAFIDSNGKLVKTRPGFIKKSEIESTLKSIK
ncbi:redoxin [Streptococcus constellatus subsp. pharyngis SK1060 = CCUG 46377]|uniref:Redoxin n=1 Tax=Streptococcus constellatus subsp. pharyngis SK1060 = CCUG 46377 TaxID=1035184 RepID=F9P616_STRCV|nr:redoxin [Streptococcus constellatus subsp. pharyngis SK1060 = CCUG 46377]GAD44524.1 thiol-disulfide isomerase/thioredoxins [Streptococcus constellatus subsp. pharyngis SK1060 = CCUG 46377]